MNPIRDVHWREKSHIVDLLSDHNSLIASPLDSGYEADVTRICLDGNSYVLKVWSRTSKPDVESQYKLMKALYNQMLTVSQPLGWGLDRDANPVLLTSFDGMPVTKVNQSLLIDLAKKLSEIHRFPLDMLGGTVVPKHDFIDYFYPRIDEYRDLELLLNRLVEQSDMKQDNLIHGDYNLGNILESEGRYTIIDWTNGQLGDPRFDIAWSITLVRIYVGQRYGKIYHSAFLSEKQYTVDELELFEAIACLRWILLNRIVGLSKGKVTIDRVRSILKSNIHLNESLI
ncbi:phosphotransferase family protein [Paenibacillus tarimensis]